jgi:hypothetical protein
VLPKQDGSFGLEIRAPQGATVAVETTGDLSTWTETQRVMGQGGGTPVKLTLQAAPNMRLRSAKRCFLFSHIRRRHRRFAGPTVG